MNKQVMKQLATLEQKLVDAHDKLLNLDIDTADALDIDDIRNDVSKAYDIVWDLRQGLPTIYPD